MKKIFPFLFLIIIFRGKDSIAQTEQQLLPSEIKQLTVVTEPVTLNKGFLRTGISASYIVINQYFDGDAKRQYSPESSWSTSWTAQLVTQYGITNRLEVQFSLPYRSDKFINYQLFTAPGSDMELEDSWDLEGKGIGDMEVGLNYQFLQEKEAMPSVTGEIYGTIPTGEKNLTDIEGPSEYKLPTGYGEYAIDAGLRIRKVNYPFSYSAYVSYKYFFESSKIFSPFDTGERTFQSAGRFYTSASFNFLLNDWIAVANNLAFLAQGEGTREGAAEGELTSVWALTYQPQLIFQIKQFRIGEATSIPLKGKNYGADPLYVILIQYVF